LTIFDRIPKITSSVLDLKLLSLLRKYIAAMDDSCVSVVGCNLKKLVTFSGDQNLRAQTANVLNQTNEIDDKI
jgi:hypothetical protein